MSEKKIIAVIVLFFYPFLFSFGQKGKYDYGFRSPMDIPLILAGNFGELRPNHFHTGIDIKTGGITGKNILSIEKGFVSRINISPWGYGHAIYIEHPNGYTSVYAHLEGLSDKIKSYTRQQQYKLKSFSIDINLEPDELKIEKGEIIGFSGNSGSSLAPHLHFEIRETKTEFPVNPLLFGFDIKDDIPPIIKDLLIYSLDQDSLSPQVIHHESIRFKNSSYATTNETIVVNANKIGVAVNAIDKLNLSHNKCGVYQIELYVNDVLVFGQKMEKLDFYTNRYINCHTDYELFKKSKSNYHKSFVIGNNKLKIYKSLKNNGIIQLSDKNIDHFKYVIKDAYGKTSILSFSIKKGTPEYNQSQKTKEFIDYEKDFFFQNDKIQIEIPANSFYNYQIFDFEQENGISGSFSPLFKVFDEYTPLQHKITLKLKAIGLSEAQQNKALIAYIDNDGDISNKGGVYRDGWIETRTSHLGGYTILIDDTPPKIKPINISEDSDMSNSSTMKFIITDDLSGINNYNGYIDNEWILMQYSPKEDLIYYEFDDELEKGGHELVVIVSDERGNESKIKINFKR